MRIRNLLDHHHHPRLGAFGAGMFLVSLALMLTDSFVRSSQVTGASRIVVMSGSLAGILLYTSGVRFKREQQVRKP